MSVIKIIHFSRTSNDMVIGQGFLTFPYSNNHFRRFFELKCEAEQDCMILFYIHTKKRCTGLSLHDNHRMVHSCFKNKFIAVSIFHSNK